jgi:subfamily B ATP-binding cassette protein MsbA
MIFRDFGTLLSVFGRFAKPYWRLLLLTGAVGTLAALLTSVQPLVLAPAVDAALLSDTRPATSLGGLTLNNLGPTLLSWLGAEPQGGLRMLVAVLAAFLVVVVLAALARYLASHLAARVRILVARDLQRAMYARVLSLPLPYFVSRRAGELLSRFQIDAVQTADSLEPMLLGVGESTLQLLIYGAILVRTDAWLALAVCGLTLAHVLVTRSLQGHIRNRTADALDTYAQVAASVQESITAIRVIKSFAAEATERARFALRLDGLQRNMLRFSRYADAEMPLRDVVNACVVAGAIFVAYVALSEGRLTLPGFVLYVVVARQATAPFTQLNVALLRLARMAGCSRRVVELLNEAASLDEGTREPATLASAIELHDVEFTYPDGQRALHGASLRIPKGSLFALVGPSGAGKSTLSDLVLRLHDPQRGRVSWDGIDVREFRLASYRSRFGVVPQEPMLFNASVAENIAYGRPLAQEEVERAARLANAAEFVAALPEGYATLVGERGVRLSGGQRQRIALARAVYGHPDVLVLDEATSSLDSESERLVQHAIEQALRGTTVLVIAHRLSTVMRADSIVVLSEGRVEALGSHAELLQRSELYRRLYEAQFQDRTPAGA